jgi:hypothetical protein
MHTVAAVGVDYRPPTREDLLRHLEKFGSRDSVMEVAAAYGIDLGAAGVAATVREARSSKAPKRVAREAGVSLHRRTTPELVASVRELHDRGLVAGDRRQAQPDRSAGARHHPRVQGRTGVGDLENGGRKPFIHAGKNAS